MEAKDTVMSNEIVALKWNKAVDSYNKLTPKYMRKDWEMYLEAAMQITKAQAEITGKIMYDEGFKSGREAEREFILQNTDRDKRARLEGIKEVVEWVEDNHSYCTKTLEFMAVNKLEWQAQKKEWEENNER